MKAPVRPSAAPALCLLGLVGWAGLALGCPRESPVAHLEVAPPSLKVGFPQSRPLHVSWEPEAALDPAAGAPTVFVHLRDRRGNLVRTFDHPFPHSFEEGSPASYDVRIFQSALAPPLPAGSYQLTLGLYGNKTGKRWALDVSGPNLGRNEYRVAEVEVPGPASEPGPRFSFVGPWLSSESGGSRQILAVRWLNGAGTLKLEGLPGPGTVWLAVKIPAGERATERLVVDDASNTPSVILSSNCGGVETGISGAGSHDVEIPTDASLTGGGCEIHLKPNFHLLKVGRPPRSVAIENAAWSRSPAPGA
ncbi:MAG TPA: hypothetical protein VMM92_15975 [Thermoanaerobaculia bacterium]|nr:hypothetical protein [Thermoanaerobaculia bacterium]